MNELDALLCLNAISGLGPVRTRELIDICGSAKEVFLKDRAGLERLGLSENITEKILSFSKETFLENELDLIKRHDVRVITFFDEEYPYKLKEISDPPIVLYMKGNASVLNDVSIAIVGSRRASLYGAKIAFKFGMDLANMGINVVSGMARGIDTHSHKGALRAKGKTVAILGCGLSRAYPPENKKLMDEIADNGAVVSEFPMETEPFAYNFPRRNRIVSGLSSGVIVVEAAQRSGALITADLALDQGRDVYAVPGMVDVPTSKGVNNLIKQGAKLVSSIEDVIEDMSVQLVCDVKDEKNDVARSDSHCDNFVISDEEKRLLAKIDHDPKNIEDLAEKDKDISKLNSLLLNLELKGIITQLPGKNFIRK